MWAYCTYLRHLLKEDEVREVAANAGVCGQDSDSPWARQAIQAVDSLAFDTCEGDRVIESANSTVVTV